jgi:hypothetical protein
VDSALIDEVTRVLQIRAVLLRSSSLTSDPTILPPSTTDLELAVQLSSTPPNTVQKLSMVENGGPTTRLAVFVFAVGVRLVDQNALRLARERGEDISEGDVKLEIKAEFGAHYTIADDADLDAMGEALGAFCQHNVGFHVWPYWREFVQSICSRMSLPPIPIPMYKIKR